MCINQYTCIITCSMKCKITIKTCKKLDTFNKCENCRVYVCEVCYNELVEYNKIHKKKILNCVICRNFTDMDEGISENIELAKPNYENCYVILSDLKEYRCYNWICTICRIFAGILVPILISFVILLYTNVDISEFNIICILVLMWCIGMIIIILIFCIIQTFRCEISYDCDTE